MAMTDFLPPWAVPWGVPPAPHAEPLRERARRERPLWQEIPGNRWAAWLGPLAVTVFAFLLRLHRLAVPGKAAFDEVYYSCDAQMLLRYGYEHAHMKDNVCVVDVTTPGPGFVVHPPLGKWLIGLGEAAFGFSPNGGTNAAFGWRIGACVFGALSIFLVCRLGRRMFRSTLLGCFAGGLLALDGLHFVQSRMAMLDIFLMFFVVAAAACLVADRDWGRRRLMQRLDADRSLRGPTIGFRPWRVATFVMLGLALGTKWSAAYHLPVFAIVMFAWDVGARRAAGVRKPIRSTFVRDGWVLLLLYFTIPGITYAATWTGWFVTDGGWRRSCTTQFPDHCGLIAGWIKYHFEMLDFHVHLDSSHPYASKPFGWLVLARPVLYVYESPVKNTSQAVLGIGTPAIWWGSVLALLGCVWGWISRRDWRAAFILVGFAVGYLPWFWPADRTEFFFYALPALPFLCLALAYCAGLLVGGPDASPGRRQLGVTITGLYALLVIANFFYFYPILAAKVIPYEAWHSRMWFSSWI